ncbi:MAG: GNAT family N-acetyltransferase [Eubacteriaceae bacterium]|jgi:ribosomal protein S18 acetylase RimI-like enzyme
MDIVISRASVDDLDKLMAWRMEVLDVVFGIPADADTRELREANRKYYLEKLPDEEHIAVFADVDGTTVGCGGLCLYQEMPSPDNPDGKCAYLMNIYTRKAYRGQSIGKTIAGWLTKEAERRGISKIYLETSQSGRRMYEGLGFRDMEDYMKLAEPIDE